MPLELDGRLAWASHTREPSKGFSFDAKDGEYKSRDVVIHHSAGCAVDGAASTFWCSESAAARSSQACEWGVSLEAERPIGAIDVTFRARSPFPAMSRQSMLPSETTVLLSTADRPGGGMPPAPEGFVVAATTGEFQQQRIYLGGTARA